MILWFFIEKYIFLLGVSVNEDNPIFWLNIKKNAGSSVRKILSPVYIEDERFHSPQCFIMAEKKYWNDILNNYKTPLGTYQFKRMLFAKKFLYSPEEFNRLFKFAISRNPIDRSKSMFFYLFKRQIKKKYLFTTSKALPNLFSNFLDCIEASRISLSNSTPHGIHFQTHTAEMHSDISDEYGKPLMDKIWRSDSLKKFIGEIESVAGFEAEKNIPHINKSIKNNLKLKLNKSHLNKLYDLYGNDFDIYENAS